MYLAGSSLCASRSNCEPTQLPWESPSGSALGVAPADTHLFIQVRRQSGNGRLGPFFLRAGERAREGGAQRQPGRPGGGARSARARGRLPALHPRDQPRRWRRAVPTEPVPATSAARRRRGRPRRRGCERGERARAGGDRWLVVTGRRCDRRPPTGAAPGTAAAMPRLRRVQGRARACPPTWSRPMPTARSSCSSIVPRRGSTTGSSNARSSGCARAAIPRCSSSGRRRSPSTRGSPSGVDVDRIPALVVLQPKRLTEGPTPTRRVSYGFRGPGSVEQAVEDSALQGPQGPARTTRSRTRARLPLLGARRSRPSMDPDVFRHYLDDGRHRGAPLAGGFDGAAGGAVCGDLIRLSLATPGRADRGGELRAPRAARRPAPPARRRPSWSTASRCSSAARIDAEAIAAGARRPRPSGPPRGRAGRRRASPRTRRRRRARPRSSPRPRRAASGCWSRSAAASIPRSRRCASASAGRRWSR